MKNLEFPRENGMLQLITWLVAPAAAILGGRKFVAFVERTTFFNFVVPTSGSVGKWVNISVT